MDSRSDTFSSFLSQVNDKPVFNMTHDECCREIKMSGQALRLECERFVVKIISKIFMTIDRGDHIVPSFEELLGLKKSDDLDGTKRKKHIGSDYYQVTPS